jgi:nucleoside-diphosphate-sugar epimerase
MTKPETMTIDMDPRQYIKKVSAKDGSTIEGAYSPEQLLVSAHRDYHPADVTARMAMSQLVDFTGDEGWVKKVMKRTRRLGHRSTGTMASVLPFSSPEKMAMTMWGLKDRNYRFEFKKVEMEQDIHMGIVEKLQAAGDAQLSKVQASGGIRILLTGGTGFLGQEIITQVAQDTSIQEIAVVIRPKVIRDRKTKEVVTVISPSERGFKLLDDLGIQDAQERSRFRFIAGDIEKPLFGIESSQFDVLRSTITHVIHCAASVSFDATYEDSFKANVLGSRNALSFSLLLQESEESAFVSHISIETSYIHGRQQEAVAREDELHFPNNFYNNHYELTKAMASIETERFMYQAGLRVVQLCPSIVIGDSKTGRNYGDLKVVNAPVNAFGRAHQALSGEGGSLEDRVLGWGIAQLACIFPGDPRAKLNLVPVDRVAEGIVAALKRPQAIGSRVHLATDNYITSRDMRDICADEIGVNVRLAEPTMHRNLTLPIMTKLLELCNQDKLSNALYKLGTIFGGYSEWGQPIHEVGNDHFVLGLSEERPDTELAFRMLCRHNNYVQDFGQVRDATEVARRERVWDAAVACIEEDSGLAPATMSPKRFKAALTHYVDMDRFEFRAQSNAARLAA